MSNLADHDRAQAELTKHCTNGTCEHSECHPPKEFKLACPTCGQESMYAEATVYWQEMTQSWEPSDGGYPDDRTTLYCGDCGEESNIRESKMPAQ